VNITEVAIEALHPHPQNSRTHSQEQVRALARAIGEWGWTQPIVIDEGNTVLIGHGRLEAAKTLGLKTVPCVRMDSLSDAEKRALLISDNRLAEIGSTWDKDVLGEELRFLQLADFDVSLTAFDLPEFAPKDPPSPPPERPSIIQPGEIWKLGQSLLICADGGDPGVVEAMVPKDAVMVCTRVPDDVGAGLLAQLLAKTPAKITYLWTPGLRSHVAGHAAAEAGFDVRAQIVIPTEAKPRAKGFATGHRLGLYCAKAGGPPWAGGRKQTTVWTSEADHPVQAFVRPLRSHVPVGGWVVDLFAGESAGEAFLAGSQTHRKVVGFDPDPETCDAMIERWQRVTGKAAVHGLTGQTFDTRSMAGAA
jgi:hypothetical protein